MYFERAMYRLLKTFIKLDKCSLCANPHLQAYSYITRVGAGFQLSLTSLASCLCIVYKLNSHIVLILRRSRLEYWNAVFSVFTEKNEEETCQCPCSEILNFSLIMCLTCTCLFLNSTLWQRMLNQVLLYILKKIQEKKKLRVRITIFEMPAVC